MAITQLNNRSINRSDTAASGEKWTATSATASDFQAAGGITVAGQWRISAAHTNMDAGDHLTNNWEEVDTGSYSRIGSVMSQSSGIWTFPSTGIYYINLTTMMYDQNNKVYMGGFITVTTDNSSYTGVSYGYGFIDTADITNPYTTTSCQYMFDVTNTTTHKCRFAVDADGDGIVADGASNYNKTHATFIRLGDT